jgi:hypothetical protein
VCVCARGGGGGRGGASLHRASSVIRQLNCRLMTITWEADSTGRIAYASTQVCLTAAIQHDDAYN